MRNLIVALIVLLVSNSSNALSIIRDEEIESVIHEIILPIEKAANLKGKLKILIVNDNRINAFTSGGNVVFINSGLISYFEDPSIIQGVVAHELGHVMAGHITQKISQIEDLKRSAMIGSIIGVIGGIATGNSDVVLGSVIGSNALASRQYLKYSRQFENEADTIALELLRKAKQSNRGLVKLLQKLISQQNLFYSDPYLLTHPLGQWRLDHIRSFGEDPESMHNFTDQKLQNFKRAVYKLRAFSNPPTATLKSVKGHDFISRYAIAIAKFRMGHRAEASSIIDELCKQHPRDPYLFELKGQVLMESGKFSDSISAYKEALRYHPSSSLLSYQLAIGQISLASKNNDQALYKGSIDILNKVANNDDENIQVYHYLSVAYGRTGNIGAAKLSLAEKAYLLGNKEDTKKFANQALKYLKIGSPGYIKANDLL